MTARVSGQADGEGRALALGGGDIDAAAEGLDIPADHVHAHAAAGDVGDLLGGGEPGVRR